MLHFSRLTRAALPNTTNALSRRMLSRYVARPCTVVPRRLTPTFQPTRSVRFLSTESPTDKQPEEEKKKKIKVSDLFRKHGPVFVAYYSGLWLTTGSAMFGLFQSGVLGPQVAFDIIHYLHLDSVVNVSNITPATGNVALAIICNEALEPLRLSFAVLTTPFVTKKWRRFRGQSEEVGEMTNRESKMLKYGSFFMKYYATTWITCALIGWGALESGVIPPHEALDILKRAHVDNYVNLDSINGTTGNFALALVFNEAFEVIRLPTLLATTPLAYRAFYSMFPKKSD